MSDTINFQAFESFSSELIAQKIQKKVFENHQMVQMYDLLQKVWWYVVLLVQACSRFWKPQVAAYLDSSTSGTKRDFLAQISDEKYEAARVII